MSQSYNRHYADYLDRFGMVPAIKPDNEDNNGISSEEAVLEDGSVEGLDSGGEVRGGESDEFPVSSGVEDFVGEETEPEEEPAEVTPDTSWEDYALEVADSEQGLDVSEQSDFSADDSSFAAEVQEEVVEETTTVIETEETSYYDENDDSVEGGQFIDDEEPVQSAEGVTFIDEEEGVGYYTPEQEVVVPEPETHTIEREVIREVVIVDREQARDLGYAAQQSDSGSLVEGFSPSHISAPVADRVTPERQTYNPSPEAHNPSSEATAVQNDSQEKPVAEVPRREEKVAPAKAAKKKSGFLGGLFQKKENDEVAPVTEYQEISRVREEGIDPAFSGSSYNGKQEAGDSAASNDEEGNVISLTTQEDYDPREERRRLQHVGAEHRAHVDPIVWLEQTMLDALKRDASDLHIVIEGDTGNLRARIRVDGQMQDFDYVTGVPARVIMGRLKAATKLSSGGSYAPEETIYEIQIDGESRKARAVLFRVEDGGEALVMRLPLTGSLRQLDELAFSDDNLQHVYDLLAMPYKLIMIAGPMGSGKTTTAHGALMHVADPSRTVWTIEDPVERRLPNLVQLEIDEENGAGFDVLLAKLLRADYNTLFLGEIRDNATAGAAVRQAKAGRQVMSTIHADDNIKSLMRLVELAGDSPMSVLSAVGGVISQRLVRRLNPEWDGLDPKTKYKGRIPIHEILFINDGIVEVMMQDRPLSEIKTEIRAAKGSSFYDDAVRLIAAGVTDREEVVRVIGNFDEDRN